MLQLARSQEDRQQAPGAAQHQPGVLRCSPKKAGGQCSRERQRLGKEDSVDTSVVEEVGTVVRMVMVAVAVASPARTEG